MGRLRSRWPLFVIALFLSLSLMPSTALAEGGILCPEDETCTHEASVGQLHYDTLSEAFDSDSDPCDVRLLKDVDMSSAGIEIPEGADVGFDLNGHTLKLSNTETGNLKVFGTLTIWDTTDTYKDGTGLGKIEIVGGSPANSENAFGILVSGENALLSMMGGHVVTSGDGANVHALGVTLGGSYSHLGCSIESSGRAVSIVGYEAGGSYSSVSLLSGVLISHSDFALYAGGRGLVSVDDAKVYGAAGGIKLTKGTLSIDWGAYVTSRAPGANGEWGQGTGSQGCPALSIVPESDDCSATVYGGRLTAAAGEAVIQYAQSDTYRSSCKVLGGVFSAQVDESLLREDCVCVSSGQDGEYLVVPSGREDAVAESGGAYFDTLEGAIEQAVENGGGDVTLIKDASLGSEPVSIAGGGTAIVLDLNLGGNTLQGGRIELRGPSASLEIRNGTIASTTSDQVLCVYGSDDPYDLVTVVVSRDAEIKAEQGTGICVLPGADGLGYGVSLEVYGKVSGAKGGIVVSDELGGTAATNSAMCEHYDRLPTITIYDGAEVSGGTTGQGIGLHGLARVEVQEGALLSGSEAIGMSSGYLFVFGGTLRGAGEGCGPEEAEANGTGNTGAALSITSGGEGCGPHQAAVMGGTLASEHGPAVYIGHSKRDGVVQPFGDDVEIGLSGGAFSGESSAVYCAPKVEGDSGYNGRVAIGGVYSSDPSAYVVNGWATYYEQSSVDGITYWFAVRELVEPEVRMDAYIGETVVMVDQLEDGMSDDEEEKVLQAAHSIVAGEGLIGIAMASHVDTEDKITAVNAFKSSSIAGAASIDTSEITLFVQAYLEVAPVSYDSEAHRIVMGLIPMRRLVVSSAQSADDIVLVGNDRNSLVMEWSLAMLNTGESIQVDMTLPEGFPTDDVYVRSFQGEAFGPYRKCEVKDASALSFGKDPDYFSIEIRSDARTAVVDYGSSGTYTYTLASVGDVLPTPVIPAGKEFGGWSFADKGGEPDTYYCVMTEELIMGLFEAYAEQQETIVPSPWFYTSIPDPGTGGGTAPTPTPDPEPEPDVDVVTNPDGSTTTTTTEETADPSTGYVTTVVTEVTEGREDGSKTTVVTETVAAPDGGETVTVTETNELADGTVATTVSDGEGAVASVEATVPAEAAASGPVTLPVAPLKASADAASAVTISVSAPEGGATVVVPVESGDAGVSPSAVLVAVSGDGTETVLPKAAVAEGGLEVALDGDVTLRLVDREVSFPDVSGSEWYAEQGVSGFVTSRGIMSGAKLPDGTTEFRGDEGTDRAMFATMLHRLELEPAVGDASFADVAGGDWYAGAAAWAAAAGVVAGYPDGGFGGADAVTREQMAVMLFRYAGWLGLDTSARAGLAFPDAGEVSGWAEEAMSWAVAEGLFSGSAATGELSPGDGATRAEAAAMLMRLVNNVLY